MWQHRQAIGLVGIKDWQSGDTLQQRLREMVEFHMSVAMHVPIHYVKPVQIHQTPLVGLIIIRKIIMVWVPGLVDFMKYERGNLIFRRLIWAPVMDFTPGM